MMFEVLGRYEYILSSFNMYRILCAHTHMLYCITPFHSSPVFWQVFIIQLEGSKRWRLYANAQSLPQDYSRDFSQEEIGEPTHDIVLEVSIPVRI